MTSHLDTDPDRSQVLDHQRDLPGVVEFVAVPRPVLDLESVAVTSLPQKRSCFLGIVGVSAER